VSKISMQCFIARACVHLGILRKNNEIKNFLELNVFILKILLFHIFQHTYLTQVSKINHG